MLAEAQGSGEGFDFGGFAEQMGGADDADITKPGLPIRADGFFDDASQGPIADSQLPCEAAEVPGTVIE